MRVNLESIERILQVNKFKTNKITRIALNALMILNNCLITTMFFTTSNVVTGLVLAISIVGSAVVIEKVYR